MTRLEIRNLIRKHLGETTAAFWTDAEINTWINEAGHDCAFNTKSIRSTVDKDTVAGDRSYSLSNIQSSPNIISVYECWVNAGPWNGSVKASDLWQRLKETTREELELLQEGYRNAGNGIPQKYYWNREENKIEFDCPFGGNAAGADVLELKVALDFTEMSNDNTVNALPSFLHMALVWWVVAHGYQQRGYGDKANDAFGKYEGRIQKYYHEIHREHEDREIIMRPERSSW